MANDTKKGRASLVEIQTWWKVPSIAHFCSLFRTKFGLPDFEIEELEEALLTDTQDEPSYFLKNLLARILFGYYAKRDISIATYDKYLREIMKQRWEMEESRVNPLNVEDTTFHSLPTLSKVEVLHTLCDYRLDAEDVSELLKGIIAEHMRIEPLGSDSDGAKYWYFYGTRLYKETKQLTKAEKDELKKKREKEKRKKRREKAKERAKEKEKLKKIKLAKKNSGELVTEVDQNDSCAEENSQDTLTTSTTVLGNNQDTPTTSTTVLGNNQDTPTTSTTVSGNNQETPTTSTTVSSESDSDDDLEPPRWHIVCNTMEDWEALAEKFKKTKRKNEKELYRALADDFLPYMVDLYNQKEKALRKKLLEMAPRRTSGRIQEKRQQTAEDDFVDELCMAEEYEEEDKFSCNERRQRNRQHQKELQELEEQEAKKRKEEEEEKAKKAKEDRAKRVQQREERAQLIAEGKFVPPVRTHSPAPPSPKLKKRGKAFKRAGRGGGVSVVSRARDQDDEIHALYVSMHKVLDAVKRDDNSWPFLEPVSEEYAPKYLEFIQQPMDLGTMEQKLEKKEYKNKSEFVDDMHLMFENCEIYNGTESEYTEMARSLEVIFTKMMLRCFPEDDIELFDDEFFNDNSEPRRSSRGTSTQQTLEELDNTVFGSFRGDGSSEESESDDDSYHPVKKKYRSKKSPTKKRPRRVPRVNYALDDDNSRDDMRRVHALRNFYSNRGPGINADPTYGVTCSHMSVMRVVDGKIVEERGPLRPAAQILPTNDDIKSDNETEEKDVTMVATVDNHKMEVNEEEKCEQIVKKEMVVNETSLKSNLSSFMKHPKVRSKKERQKQVEKPAPAPVVTLPSTIFTPTTVSKAVPAILSKGNRLKQEMKMIAVDGGSIKLKSKQENKSLFHSSFGLSNGPQNVKQKLSPQKNIHVNENKTRNSDSKKFKTPPKKNKSPRINVATDVKETVTLAHVVSEKVTEHGVKKTVMLKQTSTIKTQPAANTSKNPNQNHSIPFTSSIISEALPQSTLSQTMPLQTLPTSTLSQTMPLQALPQSTLSQTMPLQALPQSTLSRTMPLQALPTSTLSQTMPLQTTEVNSTQDIVQLALSSSLGHLPDTSELVEDKQEDEATAAIQERASVITFLPNAASENKDTSSESNNGASNLPCNDEIQPSEVVYPQYQMKTSRPTDADIAKPGIQTPEGQHEMANASVQPPRGHQEAYGAPKLEIVESQPEIEVSTAPTQDVQITKPQPASHDIYNTPTLEPRKANIQPHQDNHEVQKHSLQSQTGYQEVYNAQDQINKPSTIQHMPNLQESYNASHLEAQNAKSRTEPHTAQQGTYNTPKPEPTNTDLQDLIDMEALQEKNPKPTANTTIPPQMTSFNSSPYMINNRVLLPNSLTINHMESLQASHNYTQLLHNPAPHQPRTIQPVQNNQRFIHHSSLGLQYSTDRLQNQQAIHSEAMKPEPSLHHPDSMQQHSDAMIDHQQQRLHTETRQLHSEHLTGRLQNPTMLQHRQYSESVQPHQSETRLQHTESRLPYSEVSQHQPQARQQYPETIQQQKVRLLQPGPRHSPVGLQHTLSLPPSELQHPSVSRQPTDGMPVSVTSYTAAHQNWDHRHQPYQTQPVFQVGTQAAVTMSQAYQMLIPGHPSIQNGSFPPT